MLSITIVLVITAMICFWIYARYKLNYWKRRGVESIPADLIFGNVKDALLFRSPPGWHIGQMHKKARRDAPYVGFYIFHKPCLLIRDPEIIRHILIRDFENFTDRHFAGDSELDSSGMRNLFSLKNPRWKYLRGKMTPSFTQNKLKRVLPLMLETGQPMMDYLKSRPFDTDNVTMIDAQELSSKYTTDLFANLALGIKTDSFHFPNSEFTSKVAEFFHGFKKMTSLVIVFFLPELVKVFGTSVLFSFSFINKIFWEVFEKREKSTERRDDFIDTLIQLKRGEQNPDYKFEGNNLMYQCGMFLSGLESSSTNVSFLLLELAKNLECQELARQDINRAIGKYGWTYEAFNDMKYVDQTIAENLRLHPPLSFLDRYTLDNYRIPGTDVVIEKGTPIFISMYEMHNDPRFFDEPHLYKPDRFETGASVNKAYMPTGLGPRMCIGIKMGQLHAKVVLSMLLREYEMWHSKDNKIALDPRSTFTLAVNGIKVHLRKLVC